MIDTDVQDAKLERDISVIQTHLGHMNQNIAEIKEDLKSYIKQQVDYTDKEAKRIRDETNSAAQQIREETRTELTKIEDALDKKADKWVEESVSKLVWVIVIMLLGTIGSVIWLVVSKFG